MSGLISVVRNAIAIADRTVRTDIELNAYELSDDMGRAYDVTRLQEAGDSTEGLDIVTSALKYIEQRGDVFPWRLVRNIDAPHIVRFVERESSAPLHVVARYADWLHANGRGTSFSTFVNEFGYQQTDASEIYRDVVSPCLDALEKFK